MIHSIDSKLGAPGDPAAAAGAAPEAPGQPLTCELTQQLCQQQNAPLAAICAGYVVLAVIAVSIWRGIWNRRGTRSGLTRFLVPMLVGAAAAGVLAFFHPAGGNDLRCCLADATFRGDVLFADSSIARAFLLGILPTMVLYFIVTTGLGSLKR